VPPVFHVLIGYSVGHLRSAKCATARSDWDFALAFGTLTCRRVRKIVEIGKNLEIAGQQGTVRAITATHMILEKESQSIHVSNVTFLEGVSKQ
jgi:hypothetical protein